jgi:hypothetical protein
VVLLVAGRLIFGIRWRNGRLHLANSYYLA